jgi:entericidin B
MSEKFFKEMKMMKKIALSVVSIAVLLAVSACNTVEGLGKDIKKGGDAIEKAATK